MDQVFKICKWHWRHVVFPMSTKLVDAKTVEWAAPKFSLVIPVLILNQSNTWSV